MDRISHLPDEIISKILSSLQTKDVMQTMLLSKRWKSQWMLVPRLEFDDYIHRRESEPDYLKFQRFVERSLMSRQGQVLQSLYLKLNGKCTDSDTAIWVGTAVKLGLMELKLRYGVCYYLSPGFLPNSLYTCETLVVLKLKNGTLDVRDIVSLPSLKTLSLKFMKYTKADSLLRLLPNCPLFEDLFIEQSYNLRGSVNFKIVVPSLKRLSLLGSGYVARTPGILIDAPSLKYLHIVDESCRFTLAESINSNELVEANVQANLRPTDKLFQSLASVERLRLCVEALEVVYPVDNCFHRLKHLEICICRSLGLELFMHLLENSPNLKVIKFNQFHGGSNYHPPQWDQLGSVPRCFSSNLETFQWRNYEGTQVDKELSTYILKNAVCLKKASFFTSKSNDDHKMKLEMLQELALSPRISTTCELVFN